MVESATTTTEMIAARRRWLCNYTPACPNCGTDRFSIQLVDWFANPAIWNCRRCRFEFHHEPIPNALGNRRAAFGASVLTAGLGGNDNYNERTNK